MTGMLDPITAVAAATTAFKTVQQLVGAGREVEDVFGQLGKWYGAVSDFNYAKKKADNPPLFRKILNGSSVEQEAMEMFAHKKKLEAQEKQIREMVLYSYGKDGWNEMVAMRRKIKAEREATVHKQLEQQAEIKFWTTAAGIIVLGLGIPAGIAWYLLT
jgi:hypothetical protein